MRDDSATPGVAPDARTYHEVVAALARAHEWRLAERTFAEMRAAFPNHDPSVLVYTSLISAYGKGGQWEKANVAFETLRAAGTQVDTGVYNALLSAAVSAARYREAARVFERMPAEGVRRNVTTYNAVLTSLGRQRRLRDMESLRREMRAMNIEANETTFSVLITAHGNAGDCHRACALLDEACDTPWVYKSAVVFNSALGACVKAGEQALGKRVLRLMRSEGIHPTLVTYNTMLMGASAERDWEEVATVFRELLRSGQVPDAITLDCLCGIEKLQAAADARPTRGSRRAPWGIRMTKTTPFSKTASCKRRRYRMPRSPPTWATCASACARWWRRRRSARRTPRATRKREPTAI